MNRACLGRLARAVGRLLLIAGKLLAMIGVLMVIGLLWELASLGNTSAG